MRINHQLLAMVRAARTLPNRSVVLIAPVAIDRTSGSDDAAGYAAVRVRTLALWTGSVA